MVFEGLKGRVCGEFRALALTMSEVESHCSQRICGPNALLQYLRSQVSLEQVVHLLLQSSQSVGLLRVGGEDH